jgi:hypothetical protein
VCSSRLRPQTCVDNRVKRRPPCPFGRGAFVVCGIPRSRLRLPPESLAEELSSAAANYGSIVWTLTSGPVDRSQFEVDRRRRTVYGLAGCYRRAGAADRHQARAAASAYETAFAAAVPPPLIVANRSLLATLVATNILGQNAPATAATEAYDAEMWGAGRRRRVQLRRRLRQRRHK